MFLQHLLEEKKIFVMTFIVKSFVTKTSLLKTKYDLIINSSSGGMVGKSPLNRNLIKLVDGYKRSYRHCL